MILLIIVIGKNLRNLHKLTLNKTLLLAQLILKEQWSARGSFLRIQLTLSQSGQIVKH